MKVCDTISYKTNYNEYRKEIYRRNKEKYLKKQICEVCGGNFCVYSKSRHEKTKKHLMALHLPEEIKEKIFKKNI